MKLKFLYLATSERVRFQVSHTPRHHEDLKIIKGKSRIPKVKKKKQSIMKSPSDFWGCCFTPDSSDLSALEVSTFPFSTNKAGVARRFRPRHINDSSKRGSMMLNGSILPFFFCASSEILRLMVQKSQTTTWDV